MATKLAEELLAMILSYSLTLPHDKFVSDDANAFGSNDTVSSSSTLLVCKRWLRVATPLLYGTVVIRSTGQADSLAEIFRRRPMFAKFVKKIRLEGSYGSLGEILPLCKNLSTLVILLNIYSDANVKGFCRALPLIDPKNVILHDAGKVDNVKIRKVLSAMCDAIPTWKNLTYFEYPYPSWWRGTTPLEDEYSRGSRLTEALCKSESIRVISSCLNLVDITSWEPFARIPAVKIHFRYDSRQATPLTSRIRLEIDEFIQKRQIPESTFKFVDVAESINPILIEYALAHKWVSREPRMMIPPKPKVPLITPSKCFNPRIAVSIPDNIWELIFIMATVQYDVGLPSTHFLVRRDLALVCKKFARIIFQLLNKYVALPNGQTLRLFKNRLFQIPELGAGIQVLSITGFNYPHDTIEALCLVFPLLTSLRHLMIRGCWGQPTLRLPADALIILAEAAGHSLLSLKLDFNKQMVISPAVFNLFRSLVKIDFELPCSLSEDTTGLDFEHALSNLRELRISGRLSFLQTLSTLRLPKLKKVVFLDATVSMVENFLRMCGSQVEELDFTGPANFANIFCYAPKLRILRWVVLPLLSQQDETPQEIVFSSFKNLGSHNKLQKFTVSKLPERRSQASHSVKKTNALTALLFFDCFKFSNFPSLKEIHLENYTWPTEERIILKDFIPTAALWAKREYSVDVTDSSGKPWRPRAQKRR